MSVLGNKKNKIIARPQLFKNITMKAVLVAGGSAMGHLSVQMRSRSAMPGLSAGMQILIYSIMAITLLFIPKIPADAYCLMPERNALDEFPLNEEFVNGKWVRSRIYPIDVPHN